MIPPVVLLGAKHLRAGVEYTLLDYVEEFQAIQWTLSYLETKGDKIGRRLLVLYGPPAVKSRRSESARDIVVTYRCVQSRAPQTLKSHSPTSRKTCHKCSSSCDLSSCSLFLFPIYCPFILPPTTWRSSSKPNM